MSPLPLASKHVVSTWQRTPRGMSKDEGQETYAHATLSVAIFLEWVDCSKKTR